MSAPHDAPSHDAYLHAKRRKIRKGTHSCWECKRRKMKCRFDPRIVSASCNGCRRRGSPCISQEFPEDHDYVLMDIGSSRSDGTPFDGRTRAVTPNETADPGILTPRPTNMEASRYRKSERLSQFLHRLLPSHKDTESICNATRQSSVLSHELLTTPYSILYQNGLQPPESLLTTPEPNMHPVLIARYMLQLAIFLQHLPPDLHKEIKGLSEPPRVIMERLADVAIHHVTTNEDLIGSIESLECIMLESLYQVNIGNLRRSWVAGRRAMSVAQLMGLHRSDNHIPYKTLDPQAKSKYNTQLMWLRIIILDRHLCLLLGLPQSCPDHNIPPETLLANDCPMGRLEHLHCIAMSRILDRNASKPTRRDLAATRAIDLDLQAAATSLPSKWWLVPKLDASTDLQAVFWDTRRLVVQICHFNLLNQLHLPYMLRPSSSPTDSKHEYSRLTCVNASREVLSRYSSLRSFNRIAYSCRTVDFLALMAAMALLLAHMDGHRDGADNLLANQYLGDRGMIEQVQEHMSEINRLNSDELSAQSADLLKALLAVDMEKGTGRVSVKEAGVGQDGMGQEDEEGEEGVVRVHIPYFGIIRIVRETPTTSGSDSQAQLRLSSLTHSSALTPSADNTPNALSFDVADTAANEFPAPSAHQQQCQNTLSDPGLFLTPSPLTQGGCPELAAGGEDWAFQGVDMAFFESIMRNVGGGV
ncbi:hypothetical protein P170DRAFT_391292 [Aspergillus steynii IBT 23096]|uniref:Zn(2)-C6 fungal-type domain-containing protein n=1 Tax=Aspergillus steynii IBT 23096 TaxID=1392250 RepID=A0A2I2FW54_9EURO|nr:uncharacterized protein P170DRAFT_391292 [Aspergillus steynii IBT 23096]PLB44870.1 hypothetical protein P170DRAFT_391292 [Aspergillus steynii IBT 23096]